MNPRNREASVARRYELLAAFAALSEDDQADLLEAAESTAFGSASSTTERDVWEVVTRMYKILGWERRA
jgi:hypothetical protein